MPHTDCSLNSGVLIKLPLEKSVSAEVYIKQAQNNRFLFETIGTERSLNRKLIEIVIEIGIIVIPILWEGWNRHWNGSVVRYVFSCDAVQLV